MDTVAFARNTTRPWFMILGSLAFVMLGIWMIFHYGFSWGGVVGVAAIGFFGWTTKAWFTLAVSTDPALVLDANGFNDYTSAVSLGDRKVAWSDVAHVEPVVYNRQAFVAVELKDNASYLQSVKAGVASAAKFNIGEGLGAITILTATVKGSGSQEISDAMNEYLQRWNAGKGVDSE